MLRLVSPVRIKITRSRHPVIVLIGKMQGAESAFWEIAAGPKSIDNLHTLNNRIRMNVFPDPFGVKYL